MKDDRIRYLCTPDTEAYRIIMDLRKRSAEHAKKLRDIKDEFGAAGIFDSHGTPLFQFISHPGSPWVRRGGLYGPGTSKAGKALAERIRGPIYGAEAISALLGVDTAIVGGRWFAPGVEQIGSGERVVIAITLNAQWPDPPEEIKGAKRIKASEWWSMVEAAEGGGA